MKFQGAEKYLILFSILLGVQFLLMGIVFAVEEMGLPDRGVFTGKWLRIYGVVIPATLDLFPPGWTTRGNVLLGLFVVFFAMFVYALALTAILAALMWWASAWKRRGLSGRPGG